MLCYAMLCYGIATATATATASLPLPLLSLLNDYQPLLQVHKLCQLINQAQNLLTY